jgi:hypothetical protein
MRYTRVCWIHSFPDEPIEICSEWDHDGWETRKVEIYADGTASYASTVESTGGSLLSSVRITPIEEIERDPQLRARQIDVEEFEALWTRFTGHGECDYRDLWISASA